MFILLAEDDGCGNAVLRRAGGRAREGEGIARPPTRSRLIANPRGLLVLRHGTLEVLSVVAIGVGLYVVFGYINSINLRANTAVGRPQ